MLAEARAFLRVDGTDEDGFLTTLIAAARLHVEGITGQAMISQSWRFVLDGWPGRRTIALPVGPVRELLAVTAYGLDGTPTDLALGQFQLETGPARQLFLPAIVEGMPVTRPHNGIEIDYVAGFGDDADDVPPDLRHAVLTLIGYWFEHRDAVVIAGSGAVVPAGFDRLVTAYRPVRL